MNPRTYFPLGKAQGDAFCNREAETKWLINNIESSKHSLLMAPRRFGKTSLAERAIEKSGVSAIHLNFNTCADDKDIENIIRKGVSTLITKTFGPIETGINTIKHFLKHFNPKINLGTEYASLELMPTIDSSPISNIEESLILMEKLLANKKKRAALLLDEFQVVGLISKGSGVEAAIRNVMQGMKHLSIVFSGSNRGLLKLMFEDNKRPLYKLCRKLHLPRIEIEHYQKYINHVSRISWGKELEKIVFDQIMNLSERHPYYVNYLCDVIWAEYQTLPTKNQIDSAWLQVIEEERSDAQNEITNLSMGQKKALKYLANYSGDNVLSAHSVATTEMALSSLFGALSSLTEKDIIEKENNHYRIINPIIRYLLRFN